MMSMTPSGITEVAERHFQAMETDVQVVVVGEGAHDLAEQAETRLTRLGQRWHREHGELARLRRADDEPVGVSRDTFELLEMAVAAREVTGGRIDPGALSMPGAEVELSRRERTVRTRPGAVLDLEGLGKGRGADVVATEVLQAGATGVLVDVGGDIRATGEAPGGVWTVGVEHPFDGSLLATLVLGDAGVASATTVAYRWDDPEPTDVPLLDPGTGEPARTDVVGATVVAADAAWAEAMAKAAVIAGSDEAAALLARFDLTGLLVLADGSVWTLPGLDDHLA